MSDVSEAVRSMVAQIRRAALLLALLEALCLGLATLAEHHVPTLLRPYTRPLYIVFVVLCSAQLALAAATALIRTRTMSRYVVPMCNAPTKFRALAHLRQCTPLYYYAVLSYVRAYVLPLLAVFYTVALLAWHTHAPGFAAVLLTLPFLVAVLCCAHSVVFSTFYRHALIGSFRQYMLDTGHIRTYGALRSAARLDQLERSVRRTFFTV